MNRDGFLSATVVKYRNGRKYVKHCAIMRHNALTNAGKDWIHAQLYVNTTAGTRGAGCIASTQTLITPGPTDTTLTGEITDAAGLIRVDASTHNHTPAANSTLVEQTFTISGAGYANVQSSALFNATPTGGTMVHNAAFATGSGTLAAADTLKISWTLNAS